MALPASNPTVQKMSFASVAAMGAPKPSNAPMSRPGTQLPRSGMILSSQSPSSSSPSLNPAESASSDGFEGELLDSVSRLDIKEEAVPPRDLPDREIARGLISARLDDEKTHLSYSSMKAPSLDGKSVASATTFAMDEKESIRPDDSASVKAAEEDDSNSGPASGAASSRVGSEAGGKAFSNQFIEISERIAPGGQRGFPPGRKRVSGIAEEARGGSSAPRSSAIPASTIPGPDVLATAGPAFAFKYQEPDEKLIEAMATPKDRLFLIQLEEQVISFIKDSQAPTLDLPPCNSFCRLLAHRLGDYYALTHFVDNACVAVRLYRTPYCRLPTPLSVLAVSPANSNAPPQGQPSVKIMRRNGLGKDGHRNGSGGNSLGPSKAGSENADDSVGASGVTSPSESTLAKDKASMTREEREAHYKETRERIFADAAVQGTETSNDESRASSVSGKNKKKKAKPNDDGFEARSSYSAFYPPIQFSGEAYGPSTGQVNYYPYGQPNGQIPPTYNSNYQGSQPLQPYPMPMQQAPIPVMTGTYQQQNGQQTYMPYDQSVPGQFFPPQSQPLPLGGQSPAMPSPALSSSTQLSRAHPQVPEQQWPQLGYQGQYPLYGNQQASYQPQAQIPAPGYNSTMAVPTISYPYGQLPYQPNSQSGRSPHPVPGSYNGSMNRQNFNPQTRAFVPGNGYGPQQPAAYGNRPGNPANFGNPPGGPSASGMSPYGQQPQKQNQQPPQIAQIPRGPQLGFGSPAPQIGQHIQPQMMNPLAPRKNGGLPSNAPPPPPAKSTLSKWGTPATLPAKPPPPASFIPLVGGNNPSGQGMPTFQNGTYSNPNIGT